MFWYIDDWWDSNIGEISWKVKGQLIYSYPLIRFNLSSENNDFGFNRIKKINI